MNLKVSRILHAGYVFAREATSIAFDPLFENPFSRNCHAFPDVRFEIDQIRALRFDAVFISHYHDDHCSFESLDLLDRATPIYAFCVHDELFELIRKLGFTEVHALELDVPVHVGAIEIIPRRALDADVDSIFHVRAAGLNVLNVVDSWIDDDTMATLKKTAWDLILWPFQTMRELEVIAPSRHPRTPPEVPAEWIEQLAVLAPRSLVPSSCQFIHEPWSWYNRAFFPISYAHFAEALRAHLPATQIQRLNPGCALTLDRQSLSPSSPLPWITPVGDQNVDYAFDPAAEPTSTAEIARHFPPLTGAQSARIIRYCTEELGRRYAALGGDDDSYFAEPRIWLLKVYDHAGRARDYRYRVHAGRIDLGREGPLAWQTEICAAKLFAALELGESLSSMYLRINDAVFAPEIEAVVKDADILEDPLVRCLFTGVFGAYQKAQLRRLDARK